MKQWLEWIKTFMDTPEEWHAFVEGFCESFCLQESRYEPSPELLASLQGEHHYFQAGRVLGFISLSVLITGMIVWIIGAIK